MRLGQSHEIAQGAGHYLKIIGITLLLSAVSTNNERFVCCAVVVVVVVLCCAVMQLIYIPSPAQRYPGSCQALTLILKIPAHNCLN